MKVMAIFGAAMLLVGVYLIFAGFFMKRKNEIGTIILAEEEVKKQADIVVSDNDHDGVKEAIEYIKNFE